MYKKLSGMTGTADTEAFEFQNIYGLEVVVIPTHRPMIRKDHPDLVFLNRAGKYRAVVNEIKECVAKGQPVLVGTTSIEVSELLSENLREAGIPHEVLNAKQHEREAHIVAQAGAPGRGHHRHQHGRPRHRHRAGRLAGGRTGRARARTRRRPRRTAIKAEWQERHEAVKASGGLHIIGTERHESRRIDNQLRGRSGRQGDPGSSRFYLSLEDNLMRIFAADWVQKVMARMGLKEDDIIESALVTKQIANAQRKVEAHNFDIRKNLLDFDDVNNDQRKVIYGQRNELLEAESVKDNIDGIRDDVVAELVAAPRAGRLDRRTVGPAGPGGGAGGRVRRAAGPGGRCTRHRPSWMPTQILGHVQDAVDALFADKEAQVGAETMRMLEKHVMLNVLDQNWKEHLARMDYLRQGIHLRGYAQKQPKQEYKKEAFELFSELLEKVKHEVVSLLARVRIRSEEEVAAAEAEERARAEAVARQMQFQHPGSGGMGADEEAAQVQAARAQQAAFADSRPQRSLPLRQRQEVQALPRAACIASCRAARSGGLPHPVAEWHRLRPSDVPRSPAPRPSTRPRASAAPPLIRPRRAACPGALRCAILPGVPCPLKCVC